MRTAKDDAQRLMVMRFGDMLTYAARKAATTHRAAVTENALSRLARNLRYSRFSFEHDNTPEAAP